MLKREHPEKDGCPSIKHVLYGGNPIDRLSNEERENKPYYPQVSWTGAPARENSFSSPSAMDQALNYCGRICNELSTVDPAGPGQAAPTLTPCPHGVICGDTTCCPPLICSDAEGRKSCKLPDQPRPTSTPAQKPSVVSCTINPDGTKVCVESPEESVPTLPGEPESCEKQDRKTCAASAGTSPWCCEQDEACGSSIGTCNPAQAEPPRSPCSVTYSCRYTDGSIGRGTVTCSDHATLVSGHWGSMDCRNYSKSFSPHCSSGENPPSGPGNNPPDVKAHMPDNIKQPFQ